MNDALRDAAFRAGVFQVLEQRAKELKDEAKAELQALEPGDAVAGKFEGMAICKATMTKGRAKLSVTDERQLIEWVKRNAPTELVSSVNPAYLKLIEARAKELGQPVSPDGELVPGVELSAGDPYVSVRREPDAAVVVAQLLSRGRLSLDGVRELES